MGLKFFNTLSRSVQEFAPLDGKKVGMYCCGPTVYDYAHIGNWRTFVFGDLVRRYLEFRGYDVRHVMNITDVEDKIIRKLNGMRGIPEILPPGVSSQPVQIADETVTVSKTKNLTLQGYTRPYEEAFFKDLQSLGCLKPHSIPRATEHISEIISIIEKLMARGIAYQANDGSVYFSIEKYRGCGCNYGQLLKLNFEEMRAGERVASDEYEKESLADFALWKKRVPDDGEVFWPSPWGEGRPGWHIECSAMSMKVLGESFDLHLGGEDLKFPHHEDEIAQSEGATGKPFVKYWLHGAHLLVEGKKMSKSLGNFFTLRDLAGKGFNGREVRFALLQAHYRETFNFTLDGLTGARTSLARIDECIGKLRELSVHSNADAEQEVNKQFTEALDSDLNIAAAWATVFDWVRETNKRIADNSLKANDAASALAAWEKINLVLGIGAATEAEAPAEIVALLEARQAARKAKDFKRSDEIRDELKAKGWIVEDSPKGPKLKKI